MKLNKISDKYITCRNDSITYISADCRAFSLGGIQNPEDNCNEYYRLDASKKEIYSDSNRILAECLSGACLRFKTNADFFVLKATMRGVNAGMNHFANRGAYGFDVYTGTGADKTYCGAMMQNMVSIDFLEDKILLPSGIKDVTVELPLYGGVSKLEIGLPDEAELFTPYERKLAPIAFYGSSITQGGCVSRPGNMYSNIVCRALDADNLNLGFSGSAFGEQSVAEYLANREISAFVMDYDYNARSLEELQNTHYLFYKTVRSAHPDKPFLIVTHPYYHPETDVDINRKKIVKDTFYRAISEGDRNVDFLDSETFFPSEMRDLFAVDYLHPNDLGQYFMAQRVLEKLKRLL